MTALRTALEVLTPDIHHSDQGVQYAAYAYSDPLRARDIQISMAAAGKAEENGYTERFMRTIKGKEVDISEYRDFDDALHQIGRFIENANNTKRIHSSLGYLTPVELEYAWRQSHLLEKSPKESPKKVQLYGSTTFHTRLREIQSSYFGIVDWGWIATLILYSPKYFHRDSKFLIVPKIQ